MKATLYEISNLRRFKEYLLSIGILPPKYKGNWECIHHEHLIAKVLVDEKGKQHYYIADHEYAFNSHEQLVVSN